MSETAVRHSSLDEMLSDRRAELRSPEVVMAPTQLGAARLTRYSFTRTLLRRAARDGWRSRLVEFDMDAEGRGHAVYRTDIDGRQFDFVAFTTTLDESLHTDRVIAPAWEVSGALVEGTVDDAYLARLRESVPLQEAARLDPRVLVLTRGNRSVRFYDYLVDRLAGGLQPEADKVADAGYILRSTAFYGNGKFGMRSYPGLSEEHPLQAIGATNATPRVAPPGGSKAVLGTNPLAMAVPDGEGGIAFQFDFSTSTVALGKVTMAAAAGEAIPPGWAVDAEGNPTTDPDAALGGSLLSTGGYKGYGLGLMVEVLAAGLTGSRLSVDVPPLKAPEGAPHDLGQFYVVIDPSGYSGDGFTERLSALAATIAEQPGARLPGAARLAPETVDLEQDLWEATQALAAG